MVHHIHLVDAGNAHARVNAATLFTHLTLRCGHFRHRIVVSASRSRAGAARNNSRADGSKMTSTLALGEGGIQSANSLHERPSDRASHLVHDRNDRIDRNADSDSEDDEDDEERSPNEQEEVRVIKTVEAVLRGSHEESRQQESELHRRCVTFADGDEKDEHDITNVKKEGDEGADTLAYLPPIVSQNLHAIRPYPHFDSYLANVEFNLAHVCEARYLAPSSVRNRTYHSGTSNNMNSCDDDDMERVRKGARYFDLIVAADMYSFDFVVDYYARRRLEESPPIPRLVGVVHIISNDPARVGPLLQRFLELVFALDDAQRNQKNNNRSDCNSNTTGNNVYCDGEAYNEDSRRYGIEANEEKDTMHAHGGLDSDDADDQIEDEDADDLMPDWLERVDDAVQLFSQLLGVDILVNIL